MGHMVWTYIHFVIVHDIIMNYKSGNEYHNAMLIYVCAYVY